MSDAAEISDERTLPPGMPEEAAKSADAERADEPERRRTSKRRTRETTNGEQSAASVPQTAEKNDVTAGSNIARAEAVMDQAGERVGALALAMSERIRRIAALAREEAEDILAEAQNVRRGGSSDNR